MRLWHGFGYNRGVSAILQELSDGFNDKLWFFTMY